MLILYSKNVPNFSEAPSPKLRALQLFECSYEPRVRSII